jgi:bifunctional UDP-N-acetylglucosamine pyrophosphorylase/glucosamine-1-phosphate N-acetyltransferase
VPIEAALILAAGAGTRMWPFAETRNKCAIPVAGVPNVRRLADSLAQIGIRRAVVVVGAQGASVRAVLHGSSLEIAFAEQPRPTGTAEAALAGLKLFDDERFLLLYGDVALTAGDLARVREAGHDSPATLVQRLEPPRRSSDWIGAFVEGETLRGVEGHGRDADHRLGGVFALDRRIVPHLQGAHAGNMPVGVGGMPPPEGDLAAALQRLVDEGGVRAVETAGYMVDLDKPWHILEANQRVTRALTASLARNSIHPTAKVHDGAEINGYLILGAGSVVGNRVVIGGNTIIGASTEAINGAIMRGGVIIGDHTSVRDYCVVEDDTVVGHRCIVGHGAEISGVMFDVAYLWHYCEIFGVVGQAVDIGAATVCGTLRFDDGVTTHRVCGRRELPEWGGNATYFGDFSRTGVNVITQPGVKIGAYSCIGAGVLVSEDVPSRTLRLLKQETVDRPWGPERYGW